MKSNYESVFNLVSIRFEVNIAKIHWYINNVNQMKINGLFGNFCFH